MNDEEIFEEPDLEEVVAFFTDDLSEARSIVVRRALAANPDLAQVAMDILDPSQLERLAGVDSSDLEHAWAKFRTDRISGEKIPYRVLGFRVPALPAWQPWQVAAGFVMGMMAAFLVPVLLRPAASGVLFERLESQQQGGPSRGAEPRLELDQDVDSVTLALSPPSSLASEIPALARYSIERGGTEVVSGQIRQQDEGFYLLLLKASALETSSYQIRLYRQGEAASFAEFQFSVVAH